MVDQPTEALWNHYFNWWTTNKEVWDNKYNPRGILDTSWARFVTWTSKAFMKVYMDMLMIMTVNPSLMNGEQLLWYAVLLKNFLLDLKLTTLADAAGQKTWCQRMVMLRK